MTRATALALALSALGAARVHAATPTLAVMPLRDLAGARPSIGAALRETLTVDLRATPGVRVVEREAIDRVMREQSIDPVRALEGVLGVRVGTLLGASHLVTGAYQREGGRLRVTVRVVAVETGQVVGAAKVDGEVERLLELEDQVGARLLASVGWRAPATPPLRRARPRLPARAFERFGDAALEPDPEKKKAILRDVVAESPQFSYAADALATLEGRLAGYEAASARAFTAQEKQRLAAATDPRNARRAAEGVLLLGEARTARRYHALLAFGDALAHAGVAEDVLLYHRFAALDGLRRVDDAMAAGERLLSAHPGSTYFATVETRLRQLADVRRTMAARRAEYEADLKEKRNDLGGRPPSDPDKLVQWDFAPCIAARWNRQYNPLMLDGCGAYVRAHGDATSGDAADHAKAARLFVILALGELGRFDEARRAIAEFRRRYPLGDEEIDQQLALWPAD